MSTLDLQLAQHFLQQEPRGAARRLELQAPDIAAEVLKTLPHEAAVEVLALMHPGFASEVLLILSDVALSRWLDIMKLTDIAALMRHLSEADVSRLLGLLSLKKQTLCKMLVNYPDYTVGAWVETDVLVLDVAMSVDEALVRLKKRHYKGSAQLYVVNAERHLVGQLAIFDLLRRAPSDRIEDIMQRKLVTMSGFTELASALASPHWEQRDQVAVLSRHGEFIGELAHHKVLYSLRRSEASSTPVETVDLLDAYGSAFASFVDLFVPVRKAGE